MDTQCLAHTRGCMSEPSNGSLGGAERGWSVEGRLTTSCGEQCTSTAHWERGTTAFPVSDLQMLSSILALSQLKQGGKKFFHFTHGVVCWNSWGRQECSHITLSSDRTCRHLLNMNDDCEEASQNQPMFSCDFFFPSVNQLQHSHCEVLQGEAQRCLEAAFKTANDNELSQEPSGVGLCCHAGCFYWN